MPAIKDDQRAALAIVWDHGRYNPVLDLGLMRQMRIVMKKRQKEILVFLPSKRSDGCSGAGSPG